MKLGFILPNTEASELLRLVEVFKSRGIEAENILINIPFAELVERAGQGDVIVVNSYIDIFSSLVEFFSLSIYFEKRGASLESICEPYLRSDTISAELLRQLGQLNTSLCANRTIKGLRKARSQGKVLGRPVGSTKDDQKVLLAIKLRKTKNISIQKACDLAGCQIRTYYRYVSKLPEESR